MLIQLGPEVTEHVQSLYVSKAGMKLMEVFDVAAMFDYIADHLLPILRGTTTSALVAHEIVSEDVVENVLQGEDKNEAQALFDMVQMIIAEMVQYLELYVENIHNVNYDISIAKLWPTGRVILELSPRGN